MKLSGWNRRPAGQFWRPAKIPFAPVFTKPDRRKKEGMSQKRIFESVLLPNFSL
jgi:hypothetical protein